MTAQAVVEPEWVRELMGAIRDTDELIDRLELPDSLRESARRTAKSFPLLVTASFLAKMRRGDARDPLLRQVLPLEDELLDAPGFSIDAVGDLDAQLAPGLLRKYAGRALFLVTGICAIHCRYCFRRHFPYSEVPGQWEDWAPAFAAIERDSSIREIILSGGDPLMLSDRRLGRLAARLADIPHLARWRIHSRLPIVLPNRITDELVDLLRNNRLTAVMVVHANHPRELDGDCGDALRRLVRAGIPTLNQAVLLRGVNDNADILTKLCERLVDLGVIPYYLHQLDRVQGAAHFEVDESTGRRITAEIRRRLPGYAVPQFVRETPGAAHKIPLE